MYSPRHLQLATREDCIPEGRPPCKSPEGLKLTSKDDKLVQERKRHRLTGWTEAKKLRRSKGKISNRDAQTANLPALKDCKDNCPNACSKITSDLAYQQRLRKYYCKVVIDNDHKTGNQLLLSYITPKGLDDSTKLHSLKQIAGATVGCQWCKRDPALCLDPPHTWGRETCPHYNKSLDFLRSYNSRYFSYCLPWFDENGKQGSTFSICRETFRKMFGLSKNRLEQLQKERKADIGVASVKKGSGGSNALSAEQKNRLVKALDSEPRMSQTKDNSSNFFYSGDISRFHLWKNFLKTTGKDTRFLAQCERLNFYPTYQRKKIVHKVLDYDNDLEGKCLSPSVAYSTACIFWQKYDIKFEALRVVKQKRDRTKVALPDH